MDNNNIDIEDFIQVEDEMIIEFVKVTPYICCKIIYENPTNKNVIVEMGKKIYEMGGIQALSANYSIIKYFSPYWNSTNIIIKMQGRIIEEYFQDVSSEWKA
jgi:hypothetical protein